MSENKGSPEKHVTDLASDKGKEEELGDASQAEEAEDKIAEGEKSGGESARGKRKAEGEHPDTSKTPPKRRSANMEIADQYNENPSSSSYNFRSRRAIPCFRIVNLNLGEIARTVGKKVKVLKTGSKKWATGVIESYNKKKNEHKVVLDNGDVMELDMTKEQFELEVKPGEKYELKEPSSGKGKSVKADKGKGIATDQETKSKKNDYGPVEKIIKLGASTPRPKANLIRASNAFEDSSDNYDSSNGGAGAEASNKKKTGKKGRKKK